MPRVDSWLAEAGLSRYSSAFSGMDDQSFLELMMQVLMAAGLLAACFTIPLSIAVSS
jgi:hypothetical protein